MKDGNKTKDQLIGELSQLRRRIAELEETGENSGVRYRELADSISDVFFAMDSDLRYTYWNKASEQLTGIPAKDALGKQLLDLFPDNDETRAAEKVYLEVLKTKQPRWFNNSYQINNQKYLFEITAYPLKSGLVVLVKDITQQKKIEEKMVILSTAVEQVKDSVIITDLDHKIIYANKGAEALFGYTQEELIGKTPEIFYAEPRGIEIQHGVYQTLSSGGVHFGPALYKNKDGSAFMCEFKVSPIYNEQGQIISFIGIQRDITERKRIEEKLIESEENYRNIFELSPNGIAVFDLKGYVTSCNPAALGLTGYSQDELIGKHFTQLPTVQRKDFPRFTKIFKSVVGGKTPPPILASFRRKDGTTYWAEISIGLIKSNGQLTNVQVVSRDITERKQMEDALRESEEKYRLLIDDLTEAIVVVQDGMIKYANPVTSHITGYSTEELTSRPFNDFIHPEDHDLMTERYMKRLKGEEVPREHVFRIIDSNGDTKWFDSSSVLINWENKPGVLTFISDITERKQIEEALRESEQRYRTLFERTANPISIIDTEGNCIDCNEASLKLHECTREELLTMNVLDMIPPGKDAAATAKKHKALWQSGGTIETEYNINGKLKFVELTITPGLWQGKNVVYGLGIDVTERKALEQQLEQERNELNLIMNSSPIRIFYKDKKGRFIRVNKAFAKMLGMPDKEIIGKTVFDIYSAETAQSMTDIDCEIFETGRAKLNIIKQFETKRGIKWSQTDLTPILDNDGNTTSLVGFAQDITERKRAEEEKRDLEQKAMLASHLASIGEMASGIAHEINNPLTGVIGFTEFLMQKDIPKDVKGDVEVIYRGAQRVAEITKNLLTFSRQHKPKRTDININEIIESTLALRSYSLKSNNIEVKTRLNPDLPLTIADGAQLQQVFLNIIINAETEMKIAHSKGELLIKTERRDGTLIVYFTDDGPGIARENLDKIFDPFFTTREVGQGTGLGLSICHGIITEHGGKIYARSQKGKGATFIVELPIISQAEQPEPEDKHIEETKSNIKAKILVVDDESIVRDLLNRILSAEGYRIETADNADDALELIRNNRYNLILLDIKMPGMSGAELREQLKEISTSLSDRIVFITGDVMGTDTMSFLNKTKAHYITKPFDIEKLKADLQELLTRG